MQNNNIWKIGFPCQVLNSQATQKKDGSEVYEQKDNCKIQMTTLTKMNQVSKKEGYDIIKQKVSHNLQALHNQILFVKDLPVQQRFFRISSDLFPMIDHNQHSKLYDEKIFKNMKNELQKIGKIVKEFQIRVTAHPSQFITLFSDKDHVIENSIRNLEAHKLMFEYMDLEPKDGVVINIHTNGAKDELPKGNDKIEKLKEWLSLENDEKTAGHGKTLKICEKSGIRYVFDMHHYLCETGELLDIKSEDFKRILDTWPKDQRPKFHLSQSRSTNGSFRDLCAHSDIIDDAELIAYSSQFLEYGDIMVEAKLKNIASQTLYEQYKKGVEPYIQNSKKGKSVIEKLQDNKKQKADKDSEKKKKVENNKKKQKKRSMKKFEETYGDVDDFQTNQEEVSTSQKGNSFDNDLKQFEFQNKRTSKRLKRVTQEAKK